MTPPKHDVIPPRWRDYLYPVALALGALLGVYGMVNEEQAMAWVGLAAALLGNATSTTYRPSRSLRNDTPHE